ncbi:sel1 repeat family protein [Aliirhizobium terrae]|uniref:tetratricopeptide repeat protein n=1 Tax=Terrirhizobium terrae TaxID=2926709 RepID=UPI0025778C4D|nr:tetratricopeptide repeat protein [Rhizobium sp. CC-CFT758]WJH41752.1 sel1 repeat family protein [Rhizobium sp. CC-CFT758]
MRWPGLGLALWLTAAGAASAEPARITWEWYNAAEIHQGDRGRGAENPRLAAHYFRLAAEKGNAAAAYKLGEIYESGKALPADPLQAFYWYMRAAAKNDKHGQLKIGWCYQKGIGVQPDPRIAAIWYRLAAENDNIWGYHMLAFMLADGEGVAKDVAQARRYLELSLPKTKDHWAKWKLAHLIAQENPKKAKALLKEAAAAGNAQAMDDLEKLP